MKSVYFKPAPDLLVVKSSAIIHDVVQGENISLKKVTTYDFQHWMLTAITKYDQGVKGIAQPGYNLCTGKTGFFSVINYQVTVGMTVKNKSNNEGYPGMLKVYKDILYEGIASANYTCSGFTGEPYHETIF